MTFSNLASFIGKKRNSPMRVSNFSLFFYCLKSNFYYGFPTEFYPKVICFIFQSFYYSFDILLRSKNIDNKLNYFSIAYDHKGRYV